ncbi:MAG: chain-length determining protein [Prevotella sp.]|jgi:uncharacterized protein involved in exopolysaccharide biosynthesis|nr:chain-length determining protein [Prevotella sp.]
MEEKETSTEIEIDFVSLFNRLWHKKKFIIKFIIAGFLLGIIVAYSMPKEYTTTVLLTPDSQANNSGTMGSLAALTGINIGNNQVDALTSPNLYPTILNSTTFIQGLFDIPVKDKRVNTTLYTYIKEYQKVPWWNYILGAPTRIKNLFSSDNPVDSIDTANGQRISRGDMFVIETLRNMLTVNSEKKTGITAIEVTMQSPEISSFIADTLASYLQSYIIEYRTQKARLDLEYSERLYLESKENYYKAQAELASFTDGNMNVVSATYRTTQERLQNEATLTYSIYNQTAQQLQIAKVKVQNTTPVFTIIQPAIEPLYASKPRKKIIIIGFLFVAFVASAAYILGKDIWVEIKKQIK